ncbi:MAG: YfhO family protein, partial [Maribacter dokdonensis]
HQSITGYHAAKPAGMQDLFNFHVYNGNLSVLNMMNIKYVIRQDQEGNTFPIENPNANGNAWFISKLNAVNNANEEIMALDSLDTKNIAVFNSTSFTDVKPMEYQVDSTASIELIDYEPNHLVYNSKNSNEGVAVFSEMYYKNGWNAYIDGKQSDYFKVDYVLRALSVPSGEHKIEFKFEPEVVATGSKITLASTILLGLVIVGGLGFSFWRSKKEEES